LTYDLDIQLDHLIFLLSACNRVNEILSQRTAVCCRTRVITGRTL